MKQNERRPARLARMAERAKAAAKRKNPTSTTTCASASRATSRTSCCHGMPSPPIRRCSFSSSSGAAATKTTAKQAQSGHTTAGFIRHSHNHNRPPKLPQRYPSDQTQQ